MTEAQERMRDMLQRVEWVRQSAGNKYACPICHAISYRDGGPGHTDDCELNAAICETGAFAAALPQAPDAPWQPMETMPKRGQVIVCWSSGDSFDTIGRDEYLEIIGYGEKPALGWMPLPSPPRAALLPGAQEGTK